MFDGKENVTVKYVLVDEIKTGPHSVKTPDGEWSENESQPISNSIIVCSIDSAMNAAQEIVKDYQKELRSVPDHRACIIVQNAATNKEIGRVWGGMRQYAPTPDEVFEKAQKKRDQEMADTVLDPRD